MPAAGTDTKSLSNAWKKTNEQELFNNLKIDYGFSQALARSLVQLMHEHIETSYGNLRGDSQVVYHAVSVQEGPGKSLDHLRLVPVTLTISHPDDAKVLKEQGVPGLRKHKLLRFANEAYDRGGLLIQEDLALLLTTGVRTIQRDMHEMRQQGIVVPTRGEIQDIGPTVSHKVIGSDRLAQINSQSIEKLDSKKGGLGVRP